MGRMYTTIATFPVYLRGSAVSPKRFGLMLASLVLIHLFPFVASAAPREFKSSEGNSITAELVAVQGANIVLSMNGREFTVPTARFSQPDQDFIAEWKKKDLENHIPVILKMEEGAAFDRNAESRGRITIYGH